MQEKNRTPFDYINGVFLLLLAIVTAFPLYYVLIVSVGSYKDIVTSSMYLFPTSIDLTAYQSIFEARRIGSSFLISLFVTIVGTGLGMIVSVAMAYSLSKCHVPGMKLAFGLVLLTMFFSGGTIPTYLLIRGVGIYDTIWALVLPGVVSTYNILLIRNYFYGLPDAMEEAAKIDGASDVDVLIRIFAPLSVPMMCTIGIMTFIGKWNEWLPSLLYLGATHKSLWTAQYVLRQMLRDMQTLFGNAAGGSVVNAPLIAAKNAAIVVVVLPLIVMSPVLHKYFVKGLTAGSVKG